MPRPEVLKRFGAFRRLDCCDAEAPEDVEATLLVVELFQDGVQAGFEDTPLKNLCSGWHREQKPRRACANELLEDPRQRRAKIRIPTNALPIHFEFSAASCLWKCK